MAKLNRLGQYKLVRKLGQGGMGTVFEAVQEGLDRRVAVKLLPARFMGDPSFVERFKREAKAAARLNHPNIVTIYEIGEDQGYHFFSMELVDGMSLHQRLKEQGQVGVAEALGLMIQAILGLAHAWDQNIIHRDIKPDNLMLTKAGVLKITDLGLAKFRGDMGTMTQTGASMGTPYYMSPEQGSSAKDVDLRSDIYSLGATFYHLVTGRVPFEGSSPIEVAIKVATAPLPPVREVNPEVPDRVAAVIEKMLAREPNDRYQDATVLIAALRGIALLSLQPGRADMKRLRDSLPVLPQMLTNSIGMKLALIPPGKFLMGAAAGETDADNDEKTQHRVTITKPFYMGIYPVTQREYEAVMAVNPAHFKQSNGGGPDHPVENVSWEDAADFCAKLSALPAEQTASREYRLPTEAEWEYACRAGTSTPFYFGLSLTSKHANCNHDLKGTSKVGQYPANSFGLFDMHGNVWEWCQDWYGPYGADPVADPVGPARGERRLLRGGGWDVNSRICRSANRTYFQPSLHYAYNGFRVVWRGGGQDSSRKP